MITFFSALSSSWSLVVCWSVVRSVVCLSEVLKKAFRVLNGNLNLPKIYLHTYFLTYVTRVTLLTVVTKVTVVTLVTKVMVVTVVAK